jgi:Bax protein
MKKINIILIFICIHVFETQSQSTYFEKFNPLADSLSKVHGIPSSIMLAIAYHESGGGKSKIAKLLNNHFGIKGKNDLQVTHNIKSSYKYYVSPEESYNGFCRLVISKKYYHQLKGTSDVKNWLTCIAGAGYAANKTRWSNSILRIINLYRLEKKT